MKKQLDIFWTFFKIGLFTFGGGYAMIGVMQEVIVKTKGWLSEDEMSELITISETTPGPFAVNAATFIGYKHSKVLGSFMATLGVVLPSLIIIILISLTLETFKQITIIQNALRGINAGVVVLILLAFIGLFKNVKWGVRNIIIGLVALSITLFSSFNIALLMLIGISISIVAFLIEKRRENAS